MATNAEVITRLEDAKDSLQAQCNEASGARVLQLMTAVHQIADEIGQLEAQALDNSPYVPQTNPFKKQTDDAKAFLATLNSLKSAFAAAAAVAGAIDSVIKIITTLGI